MCVIFQMSQTQLPISFLKYKITNIPMTSKNIQEFEPPIAK